MKKQTLIIVSIVAAAFTGSVAQAGNFIGSNVGTRGIAIPGLNQAVHISDQAQCEFDVSALQSQLNQSQDEVRALQDQVYRLTPGTCQSRCANNGRPESEYDNCVSGCSNDFFRTAMQLREGTNETLHGFIEKNSETGSELSHW